MNVELHVADAVEPNRMQTVNVPVAPVAERVTVPVGEAKVPGLVSVTVTLHVDVWTIVIGEVHETVVAVERRVEVTLNEPWLPPSELSPP